ncbi:hypothetical protein Tco_0031890 [Tanacetum coccineum]
MASLQCNNSIWSVVNRIILACAVYYIWKERNERIFTSVDRDVETVLQIINDQVRLQLMSLKMKKSIQTVKVADISYGLALGGIHVSYCPEFLLDGLWYIRKVSLMGGVCSLADDACAYPLSVCGEGDAAMYRYRVWFAIIHCGGLNEL